MKRHAYMLGLLAHLLWFVPIGLSQQNFLRSPFVIGNAGGYFPFDLGETLVPTMRYQQVYAAADFTSALPFGGYITAIRFSVADPAHGGHGFLATLPDIQVNLSTTARAVDGLDPTFADNLGSDDTLVFGRGPVTWPNDPTSGSFANILLLSTPFFYDPRLGNLLIDVRNFGGGTTSPFEANNVLGDTISALYSPMSVNDFTGVQITGGLVTVFEYTPVPEPSTWALLGAAVVAVLIGRRRH